MSGTKLDEFLSLLDEGTEPSYHDRAYPRFVKYMNGFLCHLGKERLYLVGSTTDQLKVRWSTDRGDSDFVLLSGKLEVPVENVEFRSDTPCIIWVKVDRDNVDRNIDLIDNKYLPSDVLRRVGPELFTVLRCLYLVLTRNASYESNNKPITVYSVTSKVGLAVYQYDNLKIEDHAVSINRTFSKQYLTKRDEEFKQYIEKRKRDSSFRKQDVVNLKKALQLLSSINLPHTVSVGIWYWEHMAYIIRLVLERFGSFMELSSLKASELEETSTVHRDDDDAEEQNNEVFVNDFESLPEEPLESLNQNSATTLCNSDKISTTYRATYRDVTCADFVPAIRLVGKLPCMETWKHAEHKWLAPGEIEAICNMDVFIVARYAPVNPSRKDFCLSFTFAENKLSECLSPTQRRVVLVMKAYLKGTIAQMHKEQGRELRLTTFHLKTIVYRVCDITEPVMWSEYNILACIVNVVEYLGTCLLKKELLHYFIESNLFAAFDNEDFKLLLECVEIILRDPVGSIQTFSDLNTDIPNVIWLTEERVQELENLKTDVGIGKEVDHLEEALLELLRGLDEGHRDAQGSSQLQNAISTMLELYLNDETGRESVALLGSNISDIVEKLFLPFRNEREQQRTIEELKTIIVTLFTIGKRI